MSGGEMEKLRTGCLKVRCSKSCYLCDLELVDLFDNWSFRTGLLSGFSFSSSWTVAKILGSAHRSAQASFPSRKSILESLLGRISSLGNSSKIELNFRREPIRLAAGEVLKAYRYEHLLSTRQETALIMFMYMTLASRIFSTGQDSGRFVPWKALESDKKFFLPFRLRRINRQNRIIGFSVCLKRSWPSSCFHTPPSSQFCPMAKLEADGRRIKSIEQSSSRPTTLLYLLASLLKQTGAGG